MSAVHSSKIQKENIIFDTIILLYSEREENGKVTPEIIISWNYYYSQYV